MCEQPMSNAVDDTPVLSEGLWSGLDPATRRELLAELVEIHLPGGETLFEEGDSGDALYTVVSGALGISVRSADSRHRRVARVFAPDTIGEMALISHAPRSATVVALRDSVLLKLSRSAFDRLAERCPPAMLYIARLLADRLRATTQGGTPPYSPTSFGIVPVTDGVSVDAFVDRLVPEMRRLFGRVDAVTSRPAGATERWFDEFESTRDRVLYVSEKPTGSWAELCMRHADHVVMLARAGEAPVELPRALTGPASTWRRTDLVLLQDPGATRPRPAHPTLETLHVDLRLQLRQQDPADMARVARTISGRAVGLVLAGGGARGFAHLGVIRALREHGIPIDLVGGTSIGSIIAAACAMGGDPRVMESNIAEAFVADPPLSDYTLPLVALTRGRKVDRRLISYFGGKDVESLWLPFFCVSSNLTTGATHVHRSGPLWRSLRASIAIPGLLPPVLDPEGILVDGAMMNNLPADIMAGFQRGRVLAVDVARDIALTRGEREAKAPLLRRLLGVPAESPDIVSLLLRAATVSGDAQTTLARAKADLILQPPLAGIDLQAWRRFDEIVELGYRHAVSSIEAGELAPFAA
jgi:NTE family protein